VETGSLWTASPASQSDLSRFRLDLARRHRARIDRIVMLLCGEENLRVVGAVPGRSARRGPDDGRAVGSLAEAIARAAHPGGQARLKTFLQSFMRMAVTSAR
jgi:hypothetical protein